MISISIGYWIAIGAACIISLIYFYYTKIHTRCYYDEDVSEINNNLHI